MERRTKITQNLLHLLTGFSHHGWIIMCKEGEFFEFIINLIKLNFSIILMYMGVILVIGRLIRGFISSQPLDVIVNEIPNPDYLLKICLDIYLVREARDFVLEQVFDNLWKNILINIFLGFVCQTHFPLPISPNFDQMDKI